MKILFLSLITLILIAPLCDKKETKWRVGTKPLLIKAKVISKNKYLIVCRGYPREGLTNKIQIKVTAQEAALLYAQAVAKSRFVDTINVVQFGEIKGYKTKEDHVEIYYIINKKNISSYLKVK
ncbi:hypothetical protein ACFL20_04850 [Spirochaetota bacterium]